jgi:glutamate dehydrogenase (NAD(P)+)
VNIPYGGGKGGMICDYKSLSLRERERATRSFTRRIAHLIGPDLDIPAPDVNTGGLEMAWIADEYAKFAGHPEPGVVTGKPVEMGGSLGREDATGRGLAYCVSRYFENTGQTLAGRTIAVQGCGNVGRWAAHNLCALGARLIAISDSRGGVMNRSGIDPAAAVAHKNTTGQIAGLTGDAIGNEELLQLDCDILVPAALESVLTDRNAPKVRARLIVEGANGPTTPEADRLLHERGIPVIPDVLANAGGVTVSYFEWVQDRQRYWWKEPKVHERLREIMSGSLDAVHQIAERERVHWRSAAYLLAVRRVAHAVEVGHPDF